MFVVIMMVLKKIPVKWCVMLLNIGDRLRQERERLGFSQSAFGAIGGVKKLAQLKYEQGERYPGADYLEAVAKVGADVLFIVTGSRSAELLSPEELELLDRFRAAPLAVKAATIAAVTAGSAKAKQIFHGPVGQAVEGGVTNTAGVVFNVGNEKAKE
ncbi:helix-turn-helix domain-containing protein [Pseudomonas fontis]|uniref:Helix-turn-helix domain-containing protein n=1 Tax=Pseudomonas fontis TaxID=2942633 RepID=A0ABT5NXX8_9PSED|nr:helix-turn-helix transcriptional regulator [Pseudomonas fontis]MDD0973827.1 helix-turn-helix domain-containing protein [Pseudomonas fontis]MDD0992961.1 helix-turn-helix domain-containing protein [Pseudomonas fontis]